MALTASPAAASSWGRWPTQLPHDFAAMESPAFVTYDSRGPLSAHMPQRSQAPYMMAHAYSPGSNNSITTPHFQHQHSYPSYPYHHSPSSFSSGPSSIGSNDNRTRKQKSLPSSKRLSKPGSRRNSKPGIETRQPSPSARSESQASIAHSTTSNPTANSKTITYNETIHPTDRVNFETDVDELMKVIQQKADEDNEQASAASSPAQSSTSETCSESLSTSSAGRSSSVSQAEAKPKKKWVCDGPNCNKRFVQKTHLDIHRRTHSGQRPYVCTRENCGLTFSQRGNLKTHMRRHTGEKPYPCSICGKMFAQRGNVRSHEETHKRLKPFICRLDDCNKTFSQLGNMKTHQNNFHKTTLQNLTSMFVKFAKIGEVPDEHKELFSYFQLHYKNSNKGIKGRGKARTVAPRIKKNSRSSSSLAMQIPVSCVNDAAQSQSPVQKHISNAVYNLFDNAPGHGTPGNMVYEDEQSRQMAFSDRLY